MDLFSNTNYNFTKWRWHALVFSAILVRVVTQDRPLGVFEWALFFIGPLFIAAALWRLARTS